MKPVSAIVVGGGVNALGVLRSLGRGGVSVMVLDVDPKAPAMRSRYGVPRVVRSMEGPELMHTLRQLASELGPRVALFLTEEKTVATVSTLRSEMPATLVVRLPAHGRLMALMHKQSFYDIAEPIGAPVPRTLRLQSARDLPKLSTLRFPCVLKPNEKSYAYGARFKKAYKVESVEEVASLYKEIEPVLADMVVQEWIEGGDGEIYFCLQYLGSGAEVVASFVGRKIRSWPPRIGGTASCTAAWEHERELSELTSSFFRQIGFTGMGSMEYKRDARDGRFYMVEPTVGRTDFQEEVATVNGCNLPLAAYCYDMGFPLPPVKASAPCRIWRDAQADRWSRQEAGEDSDADARVSGLPVVDAYWRWNDPLPAFDHFIGRVYEALKNRTDA